MEDLELWNGTTDAGEVDPANFIILLDLPLINSITGQFLLGYHELFIGLPLRFIGITIVLL